MSHLTGIYGHPPAAHNSCLLLVDSGHAGSENFINNEFDPQDWRSGYGLQAEAVSPHRLGQELQQNMHKELFLRLLEFSGREQDEETRVSWDLLPSFEGPSERF